MRGNLFILFIHPTLGIENLYDSVPYKTRDDALEQLRGCLPDLQFRLVNEAGKEVLSFETLAKRLQELRQDSTSKARP